MATENSVTSRNVRRRIRFTDENESDEEYNSRQQIRARMAVVLGAEFDDLALFEQTNINKASYIRWGCMCQEIQIKIENFAAAVSSIDANVAETITSLTSDIMEAIIEEWLAYKRQIPTLLDHYLHLADATYKQRAEEYWLAKHRRIQILKELMVFLRHGKRLLIKYLYCNETLADIEWENFPIQARSNNLNNPSKIEKKKEYNGNTIEVSNKYK